MKRRLAQKDDRIELLIKIKDMMQDGVTRTKDIAASINRTERQTRRYLIEMSKMKMIHLTESKRLDKTSDQLK
ncbi:MAG: FaeA/PapI family transcriptional regulator, partial [Thermoproteota archaeon]